MSIGHVCFYKVVHKLFSKSKKYLGNLIHDKLYRGQISHSFDSPILNFLFLNLFIEYGFRCCPPSSLESEYGYHGNHDPYVPVIYNHDAVTMIRIPHTDATDSAVINSLSNGYHGNHDQCHITRPPDYEETCTDTRISTTVPLTTRVPGTSPSEEPATVANTAPLLTEHCCRDTPPPSYAEQDPNVMATGTPALTTSDHVTLIISDHVTLTRSDHVTNSASLLASDGRHDTPPPSYQEALES